MSAAASLESTGNKVLDELMHIMVSRFEHLVERGFLQPHFLNKMVSNPSEILKFVRQNRAVVSDQLNRRLDPAIRPSRMQLERKGIVPQGYFSAGYEKAIAKKHRRRSTAGQDLAMMIALRPKPQQLIDKGIAPKHELEKYIDITDSKQSNEQGQAAHDDASDEVDDMSGDDLQVFRISVLSTLLFKTIAEALKKSCMDTTKQEAAVLFEMQEMNNEMKALRDTLDKYFLSPNPDIASFQKEEDSVRKRFHSIQTKLLHISTRQQRIHEKLKILHGVERAMISLQNVYDKQLRQLRQSEEKVLLELQQEKLRRDKCVKIMLAEQSQHDWATAKLTYTVQVAKSSSSMNNDSDFVAELERFLTALHRLSTHQKQIVDEYDMHIDELDGTLIRIRHDTGKLRAVTFNKIYELHKQVQLAENVEMGFPNRRLSVQSATELEKERRHHTIKIQRQLGTLNTLNQVRILDMTERVSGSLNEIVDIQHIMSDSKLKSFFGVFVQVFNQTICDVELMYRNLNSGSVQNGVTTTAHLDKITKLCHSLYGISHVVEKIESNLTLPEKLKKCMRFMATLKKSIARERGVSRVATHRLSLVIVFVARKLCVHQHMVEEIERTHDQQIPRLAEIRNMDVFQAVISGQKLWPSKKRPRTVQQAGKGILEHVFGIRSRSY